MTPANEALSDSIFLIEELINKYDGHPNDIVSSTFHREAVNIQGLLIDIKGRRLNDEVLTISVLKLLCHTVKEGTFSVTRGRLYQVASAKFLLANLVAYEFRHFHSGIMAVYSSTPVILAPAPAGVFPNLNTILMSQKLGPKEFEKKVNMEFLQAFASVRDFKSLIHFSPISMNEKAVMRMKIDIVEKEYTMGRATRIEYMDGLSSIVLEILNKSEKIIFG